jgi:hypothetical protein
VLHWDQVQPENQTQWSPPAGFDDWLTEARTAGREVVAEVLGTPAWATDGKPLIGVPRGLYLPIDDPNNLWASFIRQAASYYGTRGINRWVIWDAPDLPNTSQKATWEGTIEDYYQLVKVAYLVTKQANPNAVLHLGAVTENNPAWFQRFLDVVVEDPTAPTNNFYFDIASVKVFNSPERVYTLGANPSYLMNQSGVPVRSVWITAMNARPAVDPAAYPEDAKFSQYSKITQQQQAAFIVQASALAFSTQAVERVAIYRLADNLAQDDNQAFGLIRKAGDPRPAFQAYQLVAKELNGFVLARRLDEETHPLIDYVRLTFPNKVTHVAWALTSQNATLNIPARSEQATLIALNGERWTVRPEGGLYKVVVGAAECNDPNTVGGCLIGGDPWLLVEEGVPDPLNTVAPSVTTQLGGTLPTPDPGPALTATAEALPTATPTSVPTAEPTATTAPTEASAQTTEQPSETEVAAVAPTESIAVQPTPSAAEIEASLRPSGFSAIIPYVLMVLGAVIIGGGAWFYFVRKPFQPEVIVDLSFDPSPDQSGGIQVEITPEPKRRSRRKKNADEAESDAQE